MGNVTVWASTGPATSLPWWMALAVIMAWVGLIVAITAVFRSRRRLIRGRRPTVLAGTSLVNDERGIPERVDPIMELGPGTPWP
jgi:hypothetical protein